MYFPLDLIYSSRQSYNVDCIHYLLPHKKLPQNLETKNDKRLLFN